MGSKRKTGLGLIIRNSFVFMKMGSIQGEYFSQIFSKFPMINNHTIAVARAIRSAAKAKS